ncbi:DUF4017 family protein [Halalkalibacterium halodurans]|uniref:DUF4017 family protein n=1 Tax=Halalkalibacterium halodurans TaxID=86665 RepID=UPI002E1DF6E8|nr:DUF4017 family protein [Halalkalibacterium halodurans]MED4084654.1 DUF4017 family protein [Halalkalibacterium halodurans]MED4103966.1 DUF4017 family protein [Halalkalibacterium halodurans]MED4108962.1 DUF4017 family protein [Halalkalibacterium halodurans]MED4125282.1 DUF4017 family protein [Halalkalibacterium halodurans]
MKKVVPPLLAYLIVCIVAIILPASEGYNTVAWKLFVGQIYAVPILIVVALISLYVNRKTSPN